MRYVRQPKHALSHVSSRICRQPGPVPGGWRGIAAALCDWTVVLPRCDTADVQQIRVDRLGLCRRISAWRHGASCGARCRGAAATATVVVALVLGATLMRTGGGLAGNSHDRSFWGRVAIWQVALSCVQRGEWVEGSGLGTYPIEQGRHMTRKILRFDPQNGECKCLYLNVAVEAGAIGLALLAIAIYHYARLFRIAALSALPSPIDRGLVAGIHARVVATGIAGFVDTPVLQTSRVPSTLLIFALLGIGVVVARRGLDAPCDSEAPALTPTRCQP